MTVTAKIPDFNKRIVRRGRPLTPIILRFANPDAEPPEFAIDHFAEIFIDHQYGEQIAAHDLLVAMLEEFEYEQQAAARLELEIQAAEIQKQIAMLTSKLQELTAEGVLI